MTPDPVYQRHGVDVLRELRVGRGASTELGVCAETHEHVVVRKLDLSVARPWSWGWLRQELDVMAKSQLTNIVATTIESRTPDEAVLVRPFVHGRDILEWAALEPRPGMNAHLKVMCDLFFALVQLHRMGIAHGGLKPANIMVVDQVGQLVLLDAGISRSQLAATRRADSADDRILPQGSAGLTYRTVGFAADIFAAGWVLLETIAERNRTANVLRLGTDDREIDPRWLAHLVDVAGVPGALRPIFLKLLDPAPDQRYDSAEEVLAALEAVLATSVGEPGGTTEIESGLDMPRAYLDPPLVGRRAELHRLGSAIDFGSRPTGAVMCMSGESGLGKSRLLDAVAAQAAEAGVAVLRGGAFEYAAQRPLGVFAEPFRDVVTYLKAHREQAERVGREMGELLGLAIEMVPGLAGVFPDQPVTDAAGQSLGGGPAAGAPAAIARLFGAVFTEACPGLLVVDDCQWADDLSWQVLARLASRTLGGGAAPPKNSVICSCRPEAVSQLKSWALDGLEFLELHPLSSSETEEIVRSVGDGVPDEVVPYVIKCSGGNPLQTLSVFRALIESATLIRNGDRWVVDEEEMRSLLLQPQFGTPDVSGGPGAPRMDVFVSARLGLLTANSQLAIRQGAILGRQFAAGLLYAALDVSAERGRELLREGTERGILRQMTGADEESFEFTHDRFREAVLRSLSEYTRREMHRCAARALTTFSEGASDYEIAYHLDRAGQIAAAMPYSLRAGEAGLRQHALDVAERNFKIAQAGLACLGSVGDRETLRVYEGLGTVHMLLASYDLAADELGHAYQVAQALPGSESARVATLVGELAFKTGRFEDAAVWMRQGMRDLGLRTPGNRLAAAAFSVAELGMLLCGWVARRVRPGRVGANAERARLAARIYDRLVYEWWFVKSPTWVRWACLRCLRFAAEGGSTRERARAYAIAGVTLSGTPPVLRTIPHGLLQRSLRMCEAAEDDWDVAHAQHFRGFVLLATASYDDAIEAFDTAIEAFETVGDRWEQLAAMWQKALCLMRQGKLHEAGVLARETYWVGKRIGDRVSAGTALAVWVRCLPGDVVAETIAHELRQTNADDHHTIAMLQAARGWRFFHSEQYEHAAHAFRKAEDSIRKSGIKNHFVATVVGGHLQVRRVWYHATPPWWAGDRRARAKAARRQLARALCWAVRFRSERPTVLREWATMSIARGRTGRGKLILRLAIRSAAKVAAGGDLAACSVMADLAWAEPRLGALARCVPPTSSLRSPEIRVDRGIVESVPTRALPTAADSSRHKALLDAVGSIVASADAEEVLTKLREATVATTTARRVETAPAAERVEPRGPVIGPPGAWPDDPAAGGEAWEMKRTERIVKPVAAEGLSASTVVVAFPLGEARYHEPTVEVLAALAGAVIERGRLRRESMERIVEVQEAERGRIARDLHDEFGHLFASIVDGLIALENSDDEVTRRISTDLRKIVRQGIQSARAVAWSLRPSGLEDLGLLGCVEQFVEDCRQVYPIRIELTVPKRIRPISSAVETAVFRIVQEALTNIGRHSHAAEASVVLISTDDALRAVVEDDGIGFDMSQVGQRRSLGLVGMRERTQLVGGRLTVDASPGRGTTVMVEVRNAQ